MITCSNFHSVFGFLLAMGYPNDLIRTEMYKLRFIANSMENEIEIR